jgi:hypothetical protein
MDSVALSPDECECFRLVALAADKYDFSHRKADSMKRRLLADMVKNRLQSYKNDYMPKYCR